MANIKKAILLDFLSVKPYLTSKNLLITLFLGSFYAVLNQKPAMAIGFTQFYSILFVCYPFVVGNETGIDPLFRISGVKTDEVVYGRYIFAMLVIAGMLILGTVIAAVLSVFFVVDDFLSIAAVHALFTFLIATGILFIQYPVYFKKGYIKGKFITTMIFLLMGVIIFIVGAAASKQQGLITLIIRHRYILTFSLVVAWGLLLFSSIVLSKKFYTEKDL